MDCIGTHAVEQPQQNSYRQYHSILDPHDAELVERASIDLDMSIIEHMTDALVAWTRNLPLNNADAPLVNKTTQVVELSPMSTAWVVQQVRKQLLTNVRWRPAYPAGRYRCSPRKHLRHKTQRQISREAGQ